MVAESTDLRQAEIQRIADSKAFRTSEVQRSLLQYLADKAIAGEGESIKEYTIGLDVFGKPSSFDPRQESSVRMHVARLRQKLAEYYRTEGVDDTIIVDLPKGGFKLMFGERDAAPVVAEVVAAPPPEKPRWVLPAIAAAVVAISAATGGFFFLRGSPTAVIEAAPLMSAELAELWAPFFNSARPILVCLGAEHEATNSAGTSNGAFFLGQFLTPTRKREVLLTRGDQISMPEIAMDNVVFVGRAADSRQMESIPMNAELALDNKGIRNVQPRAGEPAYLADHITPGDGSDVEESYALISHVPGLYGNGEILLLEGNHTSSVMAAVRSFTDPNLGKMLMSHLREGGKMPRYYQVALRVRSMDEMPVEISYVLHRDLSARK